MRTFDFIIVGGGTAGCLLANRLSADPRKQVALIEAGSADRDPLLSIPLLAAINYFRASLNWGYETEPQQALCGRRISLPAGKVLGGSSSINGMMYMRGHRSDYDGWAQMGMHGWNYDSVLPFFKAFERNLSPAHDDQYHGRDGELTVVCAKGENPLYPAWLEASAQAGFQPNSDFNGPRQSGFGYHDFNIRNGRRVSSATAFLHSVTRPNLHVITKAQVERLKFEGRRCTGVEYRQKDRSRTVLANIEVIVCGGVYNSPAILQRSGVGDAALLEPLGIPVVCHLPDVGRNFKDHAVIFLEWRCLKPITLYRLYRPDRTIAAVLKAKFFGTGPGSILPIEAGGLVRSRPGLEAPDLQFTLVPGLSLATTRAGQREHGFVTSIVLLRPESEGFISINSANPRLKPTIQPNLMSASGDMRAIREGVNIARIIMSQSAMSQYRGLELSPGVAHSSDDELEEWIRSVATSAWHGTGTCRMGADRGSVVDPELKVRGIDGLRVADASVIPTSLGGNTCIPTMMVAEKAASLILQTTYRSVAATSEAA